MKTRPHELVAWVVAVTVSVLIVLVAAFLANDIWIGEFHRMEALLDLDNPRHPMVAVILGVSIPAAIATYIVQYFRSTSGAIEFSALGIRIKSPSGPIVLWIISYLSIAVVFITILKMTGL